eukprot:1142067-Pelagomonas_calceolata.AAC.3
MAQCTLLHSIALHSETVTQQLQSRCTVTSCCRQRTSSRSALTKQNAPTNCHTGGAQSCPPANNDLAQVHVKACELTHRHRSSPPTSLASLHRQLHATHTTLYAAKDCTRANA